MKCPECNAWTLVRETRGAKRSRECANGHRFGTEEVLRAAKTKPFKAHANPARK